MWKTSGATSLGPRLLKWQILVLYRTVGEGEGGYMKYYSEYGFYEACGKFSRLKNYAWLFFLEGYGHRTLRNIKDNRMGIRM
nr:hypothetical protein DMEEGDKK_00008 [Gallid alphaherpesvirus 2]